MTAFAKSLQVIDIVVVVVTRNVVQIQHESGHLSTTRKTLKT
jgi:hypothetical protein